MEVFWVILVVVVCVLILVGIVKNDRRRKKEAAVRKKFMDERDDFVRSGSKYTVVLSDRTRLEDVEILGLSRVHDGTFTDSPYVLGRWMILKRGSGEKIYIRPQAIRYFEEAESNKKTAEPGATDNLGGA